MRPFLYLGAQSDKIAVIFVSVCIPAQFSYFLAMKKRELSINSLLIIFKFGDLFGVLFIFVCFLMRGGDYNSPC